MRSEAELGISALLGYAERSEAKVRVSSYVIYKVLRCELPVLLGNAERSEARVPGTARLCGAKRS